MYQVTDVKQKQKHYLVIFDSSSGKKEFKVSEELLLEYRLVRQKELDQKTYDAFLLAYAKDGNYQKVLHYALYKQRCTYEIVEYLKRMNIEGDDVNYYLSKLYRTRIVNDEDYARNYITEALEFRRYGAKKIQYELDHKHINRNIYQQFLDEYSAKKASSNLEELFLKKLSSIKKQSIVKTKNQIKQFLAQKGYEFSQIENIMQQYNRELTLKSDESQAIAKDIQIARQKYRNETEKKQEKIMSYLLRKGYAYHTIKAKMGVDADE